MAEIKSADSQRQQKSGATLVNDNTEIRTQAILNAKNDLEKRALAVGLSLEASLQEIEHAEYKAANEANIAENARQAELKEKNPKLWNLQNSINGAFAANALTNFPRLCETDVRALCGKTGSTVTMEFVYNEAKTKGHVLLSEFETTVRCPVSGEFDFGVDYKAIAKAQADKQAEDAALRQEALDKLAEEEAANIQAEKVKADEIEAKAEADKKAFEEQEAAEKAKADQDAKDKEEAEAKLVEQEAAKAEEEAAKVKAEQEAAEKAKNKKK